MSQPRRFSHREERRRIARENPPIIIELDDTDDELEEGQETAVVDVLEVPHPATWSDPVLELSQTDSVGAARLLIGVDEYARFTAAGGSATVLFGIVRELTGVSVGESSPSSDS